MQEDSYYNERYSRQLRLKGFGEAGQRLLQAARVLVIGAGGLGCPVLQYLAGAGIGTIGIIDDDSVSLSNLHRQPIFKVSDIGKNKATSAKLFLQQLNPEISIIDYPDRLTNVNAMDILRVYEYIIDASDNFSTRYLVNDACVLLKRPLIFGAVSQYEGQVSILNAGDGAVNYRDLFPEPPKDNEVMNCEEAGVLGALPGIIGSMMAAETIKLITNIGKPLIDMMLTYDVRSHTTYQLRITKRPVTRTLIPADEHAFLQIDYVAACSTSHPLEIDANLFNQYVNDNNAVIVDVREPGEKPIITEFEHAQIPLSSLRPDIETWKNKTIIFFCQSGARSLAAAIELSATFGGDSRVFSLKGGIKNWKA